MAAVRARGQVPVGSTKWIQDENAQVSQFCVQEAEDFAFSARNEVEWLNEHMADIFSKDQVNVTEIFKTPGKLRGKTPRTARKRNPLEVREPLTDVFSTNKPPLPGSSPRKIMNKANSPNRLATFKVAADPVLPDPVSKPIANTDSGYHGMSEDEMDIDDPQPEVQYFVGTQETLEDFPHSPSRPYVSVESHTEVPSATDRSFHSAREEPTKRDITQGVQNNIPVAEEISVPEQVAENPSDPSPKPAIKGAIDMDDIENDLEQDLVVDESRSPSQGSSPARTLVRKSSLTFAALPAREPINTKKSIGARISRTSHLDQSKSGAARGSFLGRITGGKSLGGSKQLETAQSEVQDEIDVDNDPIDKLLTAGEESDGDQRMAKLHNKSSTQRLHERINMLGKSHLSRPTKSIPAAATAAQVAYPELPSQESLSHSTRQITNAVNSSATVAITNDEDEDWIQPPQPQNHIPSRPQLNKSASADVMEDIRGKQTIGGGDFGLHKQNRGYERQASPLRNGETLAYEQRLQRMGDISRFASPKKAAPTVLENGDKFFAAPHMRGEATADVSTTPVDSPPSKRHVDGPLSASKSKLQSIMKTARGLFSSSAGISAQAKMETLSPSLRMPGHLEDSLDEGLGGRDSPLAKGIIKDSQNRFLKEQTTAQAAKPTEARKTRSSTEKEERRKEQEAKERQQAEIERDHAREQEDVMQRKALTNEVTKDAQPKTLRKSPRRAQNQDASTSQPEMNESEQSSQAMGPPPSSSQGRGPQLQRPKDVRRPIKPGRDAAPKTKAPPVNIRVGMPSQRVPLTNAVLSSTLQESLPPPQSKAPAVAKKASNASLQSSNSTNNLKSSVTAAATKPKALIAAERKKEQDEREAQRKLEQKREIERKRANQQEEARRQEQLQRQEVERQRERERAAAAEDPKKIAQRQAIEKRRMELNKKDQRLPPRPINDHGPTMHQQHQQAASSTTRSELGGARPPSRLHNIPDHHKPAYTSNAAKPPNKRVFDPEADDAPARPTRPQAGTNYQQNESKRRRTEEEEPEEFPIRPTMAPPIRQSGIRGPKASIFGNNYTTAPPPAAHHAHAPSLLKSTTANQAYQQHHQNQVNRAGHHPDIAKYRDGNKIPFADNSNPAQPHKTPLPSKLAPPSKPQSPQYQNGENIHLEDIPTDSESSDSSPETSKATKSANLPDWAQSPQLRELLMTQDELMDADAVFGPVASPHMEEMFRERHHRFRSRTSSANWAGQDRLTEEEIRRDVEARARLRREGGWTFGL